MKKNYSLYALLFLSFFNVNTLKPAQAEEESAEEISAKVPGLICKHCDEVFLKLTDLRSHEKSENITLSTKFCCSICDYTAKKSSSLIKHILTHTKETPYKCDQCSKSFTQKPHLVVHQRCHTGERPFQCNICTKTFTQSSHLTKHKRIHTGEKPYKCDICEQEFTESSNLNVHNRSKRHIKNADMLNGLTPPPYCPLTPPPAPIQPATSDQAPDAEPNQYDEDSEYQSDFDDESDSDNDHDSKRFHPTPAAPAPTPYPAPYKK